MEIEKHQRCLPLSTLDEYIHAFPLSLLLFSLASSTLFCCSCRRKSLRRPSLFANVAFFSLNFNAIEVFLNKSIFPIKDLPLLLFARLNQYVDTVRRDAPFLRQQQTKLLVSLNSTKRSSDWRLDFSILWTNKLISLKASVTDRAAVDQKASLTFQSVTAQIRQQRPF